MIVKLFNDLCHKCPIYHLSCNMQTKGTLKENDGLEDKSDSKNNESS